MYLTSKPGMKNPKARNICMSISVNKKEYEDIVSKAKEAGMTLSSYLRSIVFKEEV